MRESIVFALATALGCSAACAGWVHTKNEDPFQGDQHLAMKLSFGELAGFRCTSASDLALVYVTPEKPSDQTTALLALSSKKLLVIVDSQPKIELVADMDVTVDGEKYRLSAEGPQVAKIAAAVQINDKIAFSKTFDVKGSTSAIGALLKGCDIDVEEPEKKVSEAPALLTKSCIRIETKEFSADSLVN